MSPAALTLVIPCYNEERRLDVGALGRFLHQQPRVSLVLVDDGSRDGTLGLFERLRAQALDRVSVLALGQNQGKAQAVRAGLLQAIERGSPFVGYWDADLATPLDEASRMLDWLEAHADLELVIASRVGLLGRSIQRRALRHYLGRAFATGASIVLRARAYDTQCGAKLFRVSEALRQALARPFVAGWLFDVELLARLSEGLRRRSPSMSLDRCAWEWPVASWRDVSGSKLRWWHGLSAAMALLRLALRHR